MRARGAFHREGSPSRAEIDRQFPLPVGLGYTLANGERIRHPQGPSPPPLAVSGMSILLLFKTGLGLGETEIAED